MLLKFCILLHHDPRFWRQIVEHGVELVVERGEAFHPRKRLSVADGVLGGRELVVRKLFSILLQFVKRVVALLRT